MIKCPYCHHELPDDALVCSRCKGRIMEGGDSEQAPLRRPLPAWGYFLHPYAALAYLFVLTALILVGFYQPRLKRPATKPAPAVAAKAAPAPAPAAAAVSQPSAEETTEANAEEVEPEAASTVEPQPEAGADQGRSLREQKLQERLERGGAKGKHGRETQTIADSADYERAIKDDLAKCDQLATKFNDFSRRNKSAAATKDLNDILGEFRVLLQQMRAVKAPAGLERAQTTLSNSVALTRRGLRSKMVYIETGESAQLSKSQEDLDLARKQREQGLSLLDSAKQGPAGAKKEAPPAPPASPPPPSKPAVKPAPPPPPPPAEVEQPEPEPEAGATPTEQPEGGNQEEPQPANPEEPPPPGP